MEQYSLFDNHPVNENKLLHISKTGKHYFLEKAYASEFWSKYHTLHKEFIDGNILPYLSDYNSRDIIFYMERYGIGPVAHLSYAPELDCIMGIGTRPGFEKEGLATHLLDWFIGQTNGEVKISSYSEKGVKYLSKLVSYLAKKHKVNVMQYNYEEGMINLRYHKGFMKK